MFAHLFKATAPIARSTGFSYQLIITPNAQPVGGIIKPCSGKAMARKLSKEFNAIPYNF